MGQQQHSTPLVGRISSFHADNIFVGLPRSPECGVSLTGLDEWSLVGGQLLSVGKPVTAHSRFEDWVSGVGQWLNKVVPDSGLSSEWLSLPTSQLITGGSYSNDPEDWRQFTRAVHGRLAWLAALPTKTSKLQMSMPSTAQDAARERGRKEIQLQTTSRAYVDPDRIAEFEQISQPAFDLTKLVRFCEELNVCFAGECYLAVAMLTRAVIDHVPPIFGCRTFTEVANNASGSKSFKESMRHLENSSRNIADQHLHGQIRSSESLPTARQVNFENDLDVLLGEVVRLLRKP
jgi:hypothetical protein